MVINFLCPEKTADFADQHMNNDRKEELLTRWMDDGLSEKEMKELEPILASSPELHEERARFISLRERLRDCVPRELDPPFPDYFNSHLERLVKAENSAPERREVSGSFSAFNRRWLWWMAPAVTCAVVFAFLLGMKSAQSGNASSRLVGSGSDSEVYSPLTNVSTQVILDTNSDSTLLVVEGLAPLSDSDLALGARFFNGRHGYYVNFKGTY